MGAMKRSKKTEEEEPRSLRKRKIAVSYADEDAKLDALLGTDETGKNIKLKKPDIASLRRKLERTSPATPLTNFSHHPTDVVSTLTNEGFRKPLVIRANASGHVGATRAALGLHLPLAYLSPRGLIKAVGGNHEVPTFDVATQDSGPRMTVKQLADYFALPPEERTRLFNVVSFSLADTDLADKIDPPEATRQLDLSSQVWPEDDDPRPETLLYALLGPKGAYTDWHVDMGGSSVWYHLISGCKIFMLAPNTPKNIATFEQWSTSEQQTSAFLGDSLENCERVVLRAGDTLFLPSGWPHAVSTPEDSFVLGGNFLHSLDYGSIAHVYRSEVRLGVQPKFQFPLFRRLMWHAARCAVDKIKDAKKEKGQIASPKKMKLSATSTSPPSTSKHQKTTTKSPSPTSAQRGIKGTKIATKPTKRTLPSSPSSSPCLDVPDLNTWEQHGLLSLLSLLQEWQKEPSAARRVDVPDEIDGADAFLVEMEKLIREIDTSMPDSGGGEVGVDIGDGGGGDAATSIMIPDNPGAATTSGVKKVKSASTSPKSAVIPIRRIVGKAARRTLAPEAPSRILPTTCVQKDFTAKLEQTDPDEKDDDDEKDCGTSSGTSDCSTDSNDDKKSNEERESEKTTGLVASKDRRRPQKRTKQLATLVQLKEALAARASKPKVPRTNNNSTTIKGTYINNNKINGTTMVITLSSTTSESDAPMYSSSSSSDSESSGRIQSSRVLPKKSLPPPGSAAISPNKQGVKAGLQGQKSPSLPPRKKQQQVEKTSAEVYKPPVHLDLQPLGRKQQSNFGGGVFKPSPQGLSRKINTNINHHAPVTAAVAVGAAGGVNAPSSTSDRAAALKQISEMRKLEQDLEREQRLLETVAGGGVALKDSGRKLEARISARKMQLESMKNTLEGKVLYYIDSEGQRNGPFTSRQLGVLVEAGSCSEDAVVERIRGGDSNGVSSAVNNGHNGSNNDKGHILTLEEALSLPIPLTAVILKESKEKEIASGEGEMQKTRQDLERVLEEKERQVFQKKKRSKNRSRPRKEYNEPYFSHSNNKMNNGNGNPLPAFEPHRHHHQQHHQSSQRTPAPPSAWEIAAATTAAITQQESDPIWTYKVPHTGDYLGPYSTAELRALFFSGELKDDIMVHDEDGGVSTSLFTLLGVPRNRGGTRYEIEPYRVAKAERDGEKIVERHQQAVQNTQEKRKNTQEKTEKEDLERGKGGKQDNMSSEPYAVTLGHQFALSGAPLPQPPLPLSSAYPATATTAPAPNIPMVSHSQQQWSTSYAQQLPQQQQLHSHDPYYRYHPPQQAKHAQQTDRPASNYQAHHDHTYPGATAVPPAQGSHGAPVSTSSWAAAAPHQQQQQQQHHQHRPTIPMSNAPRPMMRASEGGPGAFAPYRGVHGSTGVPPGDGGLGPMRPAAELNHHHHHHQQQQQQQQYYNPAPPHPAHNTHENSGYWTSRY